MNPELRTYLESIGLKEDATDAEAQSFREGLTGEQKAKADAIVKQPQSQSVDLSDDEIQRIASPILQEVGEQIESTVGTLTETVSELRGRVEEISQQAAHGRARQFFGSNVRTGEDPLSSRPFSFARAAARAQGFIPDDQCKRERDVSTRLFDFYSRQGLSMAGAPSSAGVASFCVPFGTTMIPEEAFGQEFGRSELAASIRQGVVGADPDEMAWIAGRTGSINQAYARHAVQQALSMWDDTEAGIFTELGPKGEMIELVRNREIISRVGATNITLPPNGYLPFPKQTGAATGYWVGEAEAITASSQTTGRLELRARKAAALTTLPNELLRFGTPSVEAFVRSDLAAVLSLLLDTAALEGAGTATTPLGLINHSGIISHSTTQKTGANGDTFEPETPSGMIADIEEQNHDPNRDGGAFIMRPKMWQNIQHRRADTITSGDQNGQWLFAINRENIANGAASMLEGYPVYRSTQVSNTRSKGSASDLTYVAFGVWRHMLIGRIGILEFAMATQGDTTFNQDQTKLRAIQHVDVGLRYEDAFAWVDTVDMDLPA